MSFHLSKKFVSRAEFIFRHLVLAMLIFTLVMVFFPLLLLFRLLTWLIVVLVIKWKNRATTFYGKLIAYGDACVDEDFSKDIPIPPRMSVVTTMQIEEVQGRGQVLSINQLRRMFIKNVLKATLPGVKGRRKAKLRYPELQQHLSTLLGFRIWKQDPNFNINYHIVEQNVPENAADKTGEVDLSKIHELLLNKPFVCNKSPWEIILMKPTSNEQPAVLACRMHHILGDTESILKLLVESLCQKPLKREVTEERCDPDVESWWTNLLFLILFPFNHFMNLAHAVFLFLQSWTHPWKIVNYRSQKLSSSLVSWSAPLSCQDVLVISNANEVAPSAVFMGVCAGAIRRCQADVLGKRNVVAGYPFEKPLHPDFFSNHRYLGILNLPTSEPCPMKRLKQCHRIFQNAKSSYLGKHLDLLGRLAVSAIPYPLTNYFTVNRFIPIAMTHIPGDEEGFYLRNQDNGSSYRCSDFRMSIGTYKGVAGVMLCLSSYKNVIRIAVVANDTIMESRQVEMLADNMLLEWNELKSKARY